MNFAADTFRIMQIIVIVCLALVAIFVIDLLFIISFGLSHPKITYADAVIVLGAKVGTPALTQRTLAGLKYYQEGKADTLVLSGARGPDEPVSEAEAMKTVIENEIARTQGTMPNLVLESRSTNTFQNISNSKALIPQAKSIVVVSDVYHIARSVAIARRAGFQKVYWDSPAPSYYSDLDLAHYYMREALATIFYLPILV